MFDNATGVGRKACSTVRTTEMFAAFSAHYGFDHSFCNPDSGNEKGNVENKVGFIRRNLFVPVPRIGGTGIYNRHLLDRCMRLSEQKHWRKGEPEARLFAEDRVAMAGLPENPFDAVRYVRPKADKRGKVRIEGKRLYSTDPALAGTTLIVGRRHRRAHIRRGRHLRVQPRACLRRCAFGLVAACEPDSDALQQAGWMDEQQGEGMHARHAEEPSRRQRQKATFGPA